MKPVPEAPIKLSPPKPVWKELRAFAALSAEDLRYALGPCLGTVELIELTTKVRVMLEDYDKFGIQRGEHL